MAELKDIVIQGPDPEKDGVVRWRCVDLRVKIVAHFAVTFHRRSVARLLRKLDLTRLQPRPYHPKNDAAAQGAFKKTLPAWERGAARLCGWQAGGGVVPRRSPRRPEGLDPLSVGADRLTTTCGAGQPP